jgi:putative hydrolase of the HAD superfamily|tara:strand:- start:584 stop:1282 length:699 start_codon:yes stop_codon:yes gene_type:complete
MKDIFFDLDHTLWDFKKNSREALSEGYSELGLRNLGVGTLKEYITSYESANNWCWGEYREGRMEKEELRGRRFFMALAPWKIDAAEEIAKKLGAHYIATSPFKTHLIAGSLEVLDELSIRGHKMYILTNGFEEVQHHKVERSGLSSYFQMVLTSDALGYKKPNPKIFDLALEKTRSRAENTLIIGDSLEADVVGAREAGWGQIYFNPDSTPHLEKVEYEIKTLAEILDIDLH